MAGHLTLLGDTLPDDVRVLGYTTNEGVSLPYEVEVEFATNDAAFVIEDCLRNRLVLEVDDAQGEVRHYDGLPDRVGFVAHDGTDFLFR